MKKETGTGTGICTTLFVVFLVLKLTGVIDWSWWWVTSPIWIPVVMVALVLFALLGIAVIRNR